MNAVNDQIYVAFNSQSYFLVIDAGTGHIVSMFSTENGLQYVAFNSGNLQVYVTGETQHGNTGFLVVLPSSVGEGYVNYSLIADSGHYCVP